MRGLVESVVGCFAPGGALARQLRGFRPRDGQRDMAQAVAETIERGGVLVVEAGTGVGKTFAYLVPVLLSGERALLSTATRNLQDQLFSRDLPELLRVLGVPVRLALLKGRANYLCLHRMELAGQQRGLDLAARTLLATVRRWATTTRTGDLAELPQLHERSPLLPWVTSTRENCLGSNCPQWRECHVNRARREAMAADLVVVNHHLFFADLMVRESGIAELLPTVRVAVFDEAHQLNETGVLFLARQLGTAQLLDLSRDLLGVAQPQARGQADWLGLAGALEQAARTLRLLLGARPARLRWSAAVPDGVDTAAWPSALQAVVAACSQVAAACDALGEPSPDLRRLAQRAQELGALASTFGEAAPAQSVRWVELQGPQARLVQAPLDIGEALRDRVLGAAPAAQTAAGSAAPATASAGPATESARAWIFTSATLGDDDRLSWFTGPCGLGMARVLRVASPFDYRTQAALYLPTGLPDPGTPAHPIAVGALVASAALRLAGRTLVLTTTLRAMREIGAALRLNFDGVADAPAVLVQGEAPRGRLIERLRAPGARCVLVGSASFWEGVDVPGSALQLVVIDKLPFPPPDDPLVEARARQLAAEGRSAFRDHALPEAAVALKQGAGRLIRHESDRGLLVVCDPRLTGKPYGQRLLAALPPMRRLTSAEEFDAVLSELAGVTGGARVVPVTQADEPASGQSEDGPARPADVTTPATTAAARA